MVIFGEGIRRLDSLRTNCIFVLAWICFNLDIGEHDWTSASHGTPNILILWCTSIIKLD